MLLNVTFLFFNFTSVPFVKEPPDMTVVSIYQMLYVDGGC